MDEKQLECESTPFSNYIVELSDSDKGLPHNALQRTAAIMQIEGIE